MSSNQEVTRFDKQANNLVISHSAIASLVNTGSQLSNKDKKQIINGFVSHDYEMVSSFVWTRALSALKMQLSRIGTSFIAEMLDRSDIKNTTDLQKSLTDFDAIKLAEDLGAISRSGSFFLRQSMDLVFHFASMESEESEEHQMGAEEATLVIKSCIENILVQEKISFAINFKDFREALESRPLDEDDVHIERISSSPYFFQRATVRILLSLIKSEVGAQLDNILANTAIIIPEIWSKLKKPERYHVGRTYAELIADGSTKSASSIKQVLLAVRGFDFVPENIRSNSFIKAAEEVLQAHEGSDNFYNEPIPMRNLAKMGSMIPMPALPMCVTATISVKIGNFYGVSRAAQNPAEELLNNITPEQWEYYFNESFAYDEKILYSLHSESRLVLDNWINLIASNQKIIDIVDNLKNKTVRELLSESINLNKHLVTRLATQLLKKAGGL